VICVFEFDATKFRVEMENTPRMLSLRGYCAELVNPLAMVAQGDDNVPVPVVSLPIAEDIHRWVVSVIDDDGVIHEVCPVVLPWRTCPDVACIEGKIRGNDAVPEVVVINVDEVPFEMANDPPANEPLVNSPALVVVLAMAVRFWVFVSSVVREADVM
jgi:hypothetical protein